MAVVLNHVNLISMGEECVYGLAILHDPLREAVQYHHRSPAVF